MLRGWGGPRNYSACLGFRPRPRQQYYKWTAPRLWWPPPSREVPVPQFSTWLGPIGLGPFSCPTKSHSLGFPLLPVTPCFTYVFQRGWKKWKITPYWEITRVVSTSRKVQGSLCRKTMYHIHWELFQKGNLWQMYVYQGVTEREADPSPVGTQPRGKQAQETQHSEVGINGREWF